MSEQAFTFLNAVGTPELSESAAKRMRSHISKSNFAKRRERNPMKAIHIKPFDQLCQEPPLQIVFTGVPLPAFSQLPFPQTDKRNYTQFYSSVWSFVFLDGSDYPYTKGEAAWIDLLISEPALVESSMSIGMRHWSPDRKYQQLARYHSSKATNTIIQRIQYGRAHTDAVLAAVMTMAFGERLRHNELAWNIHIDGAAQLVRDRISKGTLGTWPWFWDLLILDAVNNVFHFPRFYHQKFVDIARVAHGAQYQSFIRVAALCEELIHFRQSIAESQRYPLGSSFIADHVMEPMLILLRKTRALRVDENLVVQATSIAFELIIYLSWSPRPGAINLTAIAGELKEAICGLPVRPCSYMDLTSCQLIVGAIAAYKDSPTRAWFVDKFKNVLHALKSRGWDNAIDILEKGFALDESLVTRFTELRKELD
ncbi:hypothetical protein F5Y19DRAFT_422399, partial [Xylariaceae sp. FL1651]